MIRLIIPQARPNPSILGRLGRLAHWCALVVAVLLLVPAWFAMVQAPITPTLANPYPPKGLPWDTFVILAAFVAMVGRGLRYLLAGE